MSQLQFTFSGKLHDTLDAVPYNAFVTSKDVGEKLKIDPSLAAARLKILLDNDVVYRKRTRHGYYLWTRSKTLPLVDEKPVIDQPSRAGAPMARVNIAEYLKQNVGTTLTTQDIIDATGYDLVTVRSMMSDLYRLGYVERDKEGREWLFMPDESIEHYAPKPKGGGKHKKVVKEIAAPAKPARLSIEDFTAAFNQMQSQRDEYRAALEAIQSILTRTIK